ncbi:MAG: RNA polymerase sigma-54 factor, partial [Muriicola sp.]|nr:RNA polymerase sigma-54 factor [Muriicola sp.]
MLKQHLQFKLSQKLSPQQIQLMKLIQLPTQAFEQRLKQELEENPALETGKEETETYEDEFEDVYEGNDESETINTEDINIDDYLSDDEIPDYRTKTSNYSADEEEKTVPYAAGTSFNQYLINQLNTFYLSDEEWSIAEFLVGSVDESGYIRRPISDIMDDLAFTQNIYTDKETIEKVLNIVQDLDPPGVAARSLDECLLIQLRRKDPSPAIDLAILILEKSFDHFTKKHYKKLIQKHNISEEELRDAISEIEKLNPKPGGSYSGNNRIIEHIVPDFSIRIVEG